MELIDKSALVAEIRKMIKNAELYIEYHHDNNDRLCYSFKHQRLAMWELLSFIDTLEVKVVDLEKEIEGYIDSLEVWKVQESPLTTLEDAAKYFFELGLSVNNPTTVADRGIINGIIATLNAFGEENMISYDKEIEWLRSKAQKGE